MPEDAPVMRTTFPAMFSLKTGRMALETKNLMKRYGGRKKRSKVRAIGGITMFITLLSISMASLQREIEREIGGTV